MYKCVCVCEMCMCQHNKQLDTVAVCIFLSLVFVVWLSQWGCQVCAIVPIKRSIPYQAAHAVAGDTAQKCLADR